MENVGDVNEFPRDTRGRDNVRPTFVVVVVDPFTLD